MCMWWENGCMAVRTPAINIENDIRGILCGELRPGGLLNK